MLPLRYPKLWSAVGWLLVIGVVVGSLSPGQALPDFRISDKVQHGAAYCALMVWFAGLYRRGRYPLIVAILLLLGAGLEVLQGTTRTRSLDWYDMAANSAGIAVGLGLALSIAGGWCERLERRLLS